MKKSIIFLFVGTLALLADKPVYVDEVLTKENSIKMNLTIAYSNIQYTQGIQENITYQTQNGDFVSIPTYIGNTNNNQDYLNYDLALRYGVTKDLEIFASLNFYNLTNHLSLNNNFSTESNHGFNSAIFGMNYQVKKEDDSPSLLIGLSTTIQERIRFGEEETNSNFKSHRLYATSFYTVDPIVFAISSSYGINQKKTNDTLSLTNGNILTISPQIYFAVNPYTSLSAGVKYMHIQSSKQNNTQITNSASYLSFLMGMSYEVSNNTVLNISSEYINNHNRSQANFSTTLSYSF